MNFAIRLIRRRAVLIRHISPILRPIFSQKGLLKLTKNTLISYLIVSTVLLGSGLIYLFGPFTKSSKAVWFDDNFAYRQNVALITAGKIQ